MTNKFKLSGSKLRKLRRRSGKTLLELGLESGVEPSYLSKIERGERPFTIPSAKKLALTLNVFIDEFLED
jgi:transcriptional regulator with XRE-family HTH domain